MTKDEIKALAIRCGFTLREQPYGNMDLYPYIYDFAERLLKTQLEQMLAEGWRQCAKDQHTTQFCGQLEAAVLAEREACAELCLKHANVLKIGGVIAKHIRARNTP